MVHFQYSSEEPLTIRIVDEFSHPDTERIALLLESSFEGGFDKEIVFQVESDLPKKQMKLLGDFCQRLPYEFHIDLKYPILEWQGF